MPKNHIHLCPTVQRTCFRTYDNDLQAAADMEYVALNTLLLHRMFRQNEPWDRLMLICSETG